jgi:hypothetical protein
MRDHFTEADKERLRPARERVINCMVGRGWIDLDQVAKEVGIRVGTVASKLREVCDKDHAYLGLAYDRMRDENRPGIHLYRLFIRIPEQLNLLEESRHVS